MNTKPLVDRFWSKVQKTPDGCWFWFGSVEKDGYGRINLGSEFGKRRVRVHRLSWELHNGRPVPEKLLVLHKCDQPLCVRPDHLFVGTAQDNSSDMVKKGRQANGELCARTKFDVELVTKVRKEYRQKMSSAIKAIAKKHGVLYGWVWDIVARRSWHHLSETTVAPDSRA